MQRFKLTLEYNGRPFCGWQKQASGPSVQSCLESAAAELEGKPVLVQGAGRTDAGVHACGQVAHLDLIRTITADRLCAALNALIRHAPVTVLSAEPVDLTFHARFSALERRYLYRILDRYAPPALNAGFVWWAKKSLAVQPMHEAAQILVGAHDFNSFRTSQCQATSAYKTLDQLTVCRVGSEIHIHAQARSFLHHQVRIIVGSLAQIGTGRWSQQHLYKILAARNRAAAGPTAPPEGLMLTHVGY